MSELSQEQFNSDEFLRGQKDCINGVTHTAGQSDEYNRGYNAEYQNEQNMTEFSKGYD